MVLFKGLHFEGVRLGTDWNCAISSGGGGGHFKIITTKLIDGLKPFHTFFGQKYLLYIF
jgi:hypothetical protein